ncbi:MAG: motility protein A [Synergistales bacterium]|nr:motility protein A [Synergistales bacterium]MDY6400833.1 motility protein A [Synergistales bacterium]MDY6405459.1 motility protein A [Synergistales bacterium]MDY6410488.1 motility protein A [Synergistales bacterium]MDY6414626.1 motility protein A [Synergistales bacterium]
MDLTSLIGFLATWILVIASMAAGGNLGAYIDIPSVMITLGGAIGATVISNPGNRLKAVGGALKSVFISHAPDLIGMVQMIVSFAEKARREGLLSLEADVAEVESDFMRKAIQLVVDGTDPELVRAILDTEIGVFEDRHSANKTVFDNLAEFGPSFGMIGTLIGLIAMLGNLADVSALGPGMAVALITTMYGSMLANMFAIPTAKKLAARSAEEVKAMELMVEGILAIQAGENPRIVEEKLKVYLPPKMREAFNQEGE